MPGRAPRRLFSLGVCSLSAWIACSEPPPPDPPPDAGTPEISPCPRFILAPVTLATASDVSFALALPGDEVLVGTADQRVFRLAANVAPSTVAAELGELRFASGLALSSGEIWLGNQHGCLIRGRLSGAALTLEREACEPAGAAILAMVAHEAPAGVTIHLITRLGELLRWRASEGFTSMHRFGALFDDARLARDQTGRVYGAVYPAQEILSLDGDVKSLQPVPVIGEAVTALDFVSGVGLLVGDSSGSVFLREGEAWTHLGDPGIFYGITAFAATPKGLLVVGGTGEGSVYAAGKFCPLEQLGAGVVFFVRPLGDGWLLIGRRHQSSQILGGTWVRIAH